MRSAAVLPDLETFGAEARAFSHELRAKETGATLVTLSGDLGAGKTTFVQALGSVLGVKESITSPTFVLARYYELPEDAAFSRLVHIDAYRLKGGSELQALGFSEAMSDPQTLVLLEWPEMVIDSLPEADVAIRLETLPDHSRSITYAYRSYV